MLNRKLLGLTNVILAAGILSACSSGIQRADIPATARPDAEVERLHSELTAAQQAQVDVLAPKYFTASQYYLQKADEQLRDKKKGSDILESVSYSAGALNQAQEIASRAQTVIPDVVEARGRAVQAQADKYQNQELAKNDNRLKKMASKFEKGNFDPNLTDRQALQTNYFNVEVQSVLSSRLSRARNIFDAAHKDGAEKYSPKSLAEFYSQIHSAELKMTAAVRQPEILDQLEADINAKADMMTRILAESKHTRKESTEQVALEKVKEHDQLNAVHGNLVETKRELNEMSSENQELEAREKINKYLETAQNKLTKDEAEVAREGDQIIIRLKGMNFPTGRADITKSSIPVLKKVTEILSSIKSDKKVVVQGHADGRGTSKLNQKLSEERANTIAQYLVSANAVQKGNVTSQGASFEKPIASNKRSAGRAENRRVDIIVTP